MIDFEAWADELEHAAGICVDEGYNGTAVNLRAIAAALPQLREDIANSARYTWLKGASRTEYLLARGMFGLSDQEIDSVIADRSAEATDK